MILDKLRLRPQTPVSAELMDTSGLSKILLNSWVGQNLTLEFTGKMNCIHCGSALRKCFSQGYCYSCSQTLARCDLCLMKPETCHFHLGTCREPAWGIAHCFQPHIVYLANSTGPKIGITRKINVPYRWLDQGAIQATALFEVRSRVQAGILEQIGRTFVSDKTNWRQLIREDSPWIDLEMNAMSLQESIWQAFLKSSAFSPDEVLRLPFQEHRYSYPLLRYPSHNRSLNLHKESTVKGELLGIKGQYLLFEEGGLNIRALTGCEVRLSFDS
jgi:hypothetical protein